MFQNNTELIALFKSLEDVHENNVLEIYLALAEYEEEYKTIPHSAQIPTIYDAYEKYYSHLGLSHKVTQIFNDINWEEIMQHFDVQKIFSEIPEEYKDILTPFLENLVSEL